MQAISVSSLNEQIKQTLESTFLQVVVEGELARVTYHASGHVYFSIKDDSSSLKAVMFKGNASKLNFTLQEGKKVVLFGAITLYKPRGEYQLNVSDAQEFGVGNLTIEFEKLKTKLKDQGYFDTARKTLKPKVVGSMALITSSTGAALQDMLHVAAKRWPLVEIVLIDVLVQGQAAASQIAQAITYADTLKVDAIVVGRGGGSIEDLWAFNEEAVAHALFNCRTFTVSAVGHEIDYTISDYVADMRAATPSAAMELVLSDQWEIRQYMDTLITNSSQNLETKLQHYARQIAQIRESYSAYSIDKRLEHYQNSITSMQKEFVYYMHASIEHKERQTTQILGELEFAMTRMLSNKQHTIDNLLAKLQAHNPKNRDIKGYAQVAKEGKIVSLEELAVDDVVTLSTALVSHEAVITKSKTL